MCIGASDVRKLTMPFGPPRAELAQQMLPFGGELPRRLGHADVRNGANELRLIERVAALARFGMDRGQVSIDARYRIIVRQEARQLRMMTVPTRRSL